MRNPRRESLDRPASALRFGHYALLERLGAGGMAEVWRARDEARDGRLVALKRILPHLSAVPEIADMFRAEAAISLRLVHPNVTSTFEVGQIDGRSFLAMEYVDGVDLSSLLARGPIPRWLAVHIARDVSRALGYVHGLLDEHGAPLMLVHRDVSPSNIRLRKDGVAILLDFGIAKALTDTASQKTRTGAVKGKPGYIAPERLDGSPASQGSDQFSVGIVLSEMLDAEPDANTPLGLIATRASAAEPHDRFPSAAALCDALEDAAQRELASARRAAAWLETEAVLSAQASSRTDLPTRTDLGFARGAGAVGSRTRRWRSPVLAGGLLIAALAGAALLGSATRESEPSVQGAARIPATPRLPLSPAQDAASTPDAGAQHPPPRKRENKKRSAAHDADAILGQRFH